MGVDLVPAMLEVANRRIARYKWANVETYEAGAAKLNFPDQHFDKAVCTFALNIIPDNIGAIAEVRRIIVPGSRFVALDFNSNPAFLTRWRRLSPWFTRMARICAVDVTRRTIEGLQSAFTQVQIKYYWAGLVFIVKATK